jgi:hypothetical protein
MQLVADATIASCERQMLKLQSSGASTIQLPTNLKNSTLGGEVALAQAVVTWAKACANPVLATYARGADDEQLERLTRRLPGLAAALCIRRATSNTGDITGALQARALDVIKRVQSERYGLRVRGPSMDLVCADPHALGTPVALYRNGPEGSAVVRDRMDFRTLAQQVMLTAVPPAYHQDVDSEMQEAVGGLLYEVFRNTEDHALTDISGNVLEHSIRALRVAHVSPTEPEIMAMAESFDSLAEFCRRQVPHPGKRQVHLVELSILDSGPGFAQRLTGRPLESMSLEEEKTAVLSSFTLATSKRRKGFGQGLPHVARVLAEKGGFLRLRTGRLCLFADFGAEAISDADGARLKQWCLPGVDRLAQVSGALLTIFIPIRRSA